MSIDVNADIGESDEPDGMAREAELFRGITSASIACGGHAGDAETMRIAVGRALDAGVGIGAHVSYADREGFGRTRLDVPHAVLREQVLEQFDALAAVVDAAGGTIRHVKPHGALYNAIADDAELAAVVLGAVAERSPGIAAFAMPGTAAASVAGGLGLRVVAEGFPERGYGPHGRLLPRSAPGAIVEDPDEVGARAVELAGAVATLCLHSDHPTALGNLAAMRAALDAAGIAVRHWAADS